MEIELSADINAEESKTINRICTVAVERICSRLPLSNVKICIFLDDSQTIPEWGVGGYCENANQIDIALSPGRKSDWQSHLPRTIAHEWHHLARWRGPGYGTTLSQVLISEGLAQHFEVNCFPGPPSFFSTILSVQERANILAVFVNEFHETQFDHARWFFGKGEFPFQAGYDLSFTVIGKYLEIKRALAADEVELTPEQLLQALPDLSAKQP